jgi:predicted ArsR family transcriptional regulator
MLLKSRGPLRTAQIAELLRVTPTGARQLLGLLQQDELLSSSEEADGVGRPARLWRLTQKAQARFPDRHADLTLSLIDATRAAFGERGLRKLIDVHEDSQLQRYRQALAGLDTLAQKVRTLVRVRSAEGYMAQAHARADGSFVLAENHCPICAAAQSCQGFCRSELEVFQRVLGKSVQVERIEHLLSGARRCAYHVSMKRQPRAT